MKNNYEYSKKLLHWSQVHGIQFIYASSASVYGLGLNGFIETLIVNYPLTCMRIQSIFLTIMLEVIHPLLVPKLLVSIL